MKLKPAIPTIKWGGVATVWVGAMYLTEAESEGNVWMRGGKFNK